MGNYRFLLEKTYHVISDGFFVVDKEEERVLLKGLGKPTAPSQTMPRNAPDPFWMSSFNTGYDARALRCHPNKTQNTTHPNVL